MAAQAALIAETVAGMKRAVSGSQYSSDSEDDFFANTNRGNKLKRKAQYVQEGKLDMPNGPKVYRRKINHAGYERYIINRNPTRYDEDGDELDDDDTDEQADADANARNPYHEIRLEELLAPLTSAADLPTHPSLSVPYRSKTLSDMVQQACTMLHRERKTLWGVKQLLTKLRGDETWIPCGNIESEIDNIIFDTKSIYQEAAKLGIRSASFDFDDQRQNNESGSSRADKQDNPPTKDDHQKFSSGAQMNATSEASIKADINIEADPPDSGQNVAPGHVFDIPAGGKADFEVIDAKDHPDEETPLAEKHSSNELGRSENYPTRISESAGSDPNLTNGAPSSEPLDVAQDVKMINSAPRDRQAQEDEKIHLVDGKPAASTNGVLIASDGKTEKGEGSVGEGDVKPAPHRMRTRAQAQAASDKTASSRTRSVSPVPWVPPPVHPLYLMPASARPDRNFGLPAEEAEEIRRMVMLYIQKQEEVCRGAEKLYIGLLRADRMRKTVFKWCKAEGHIGEMSDGEDWYDKEEWGLDEDLRKGHDDEEDDAATQVKKTRGRRS